MPHPMEKLADRVLVGRDADALSLMKDIMAHAEEFAIYLETSDPKLDRWQHLDPLWVAEVYEALATGLGYEDRHEPRDSDLFQADREDRAAVGSAFQEVLVPSLPSGSLNCLIDSLKSLGVDPRSFGRHALDREPDVLAGGLHAIELARYGITPVDLVLASDGLAMLLDRASDAGVFTASPSLTVHLTEGQVLKIDEVDAARGELCRTELVDEVAAMTGLNEQVSAALLDWLAGASGSIPCLLAGYTSRFDPAGVRLVATEASEHQRNVLRRWRSHEALAPMLIAA